MIHTFVRSVIAFLCLISCSQPQKAIESISSTDQNLTFLVQKELFFNCNFSLGSDSMIRFMGNLPHFSLDKEYPSAGGQAIKFITNGAAYRGCPLQDKKTWVFWNTYFPEKKCDFVQSCMNFVHKKDKDAQLERLKKLFDSQPLLKHQVRTDLINEKYDRYECASFAFNLKTSPADSSFNLIQTQLQFFSK